MELKSIASDKGIHIRPVDLLRPDDLYMDSVKKGKERKTYIGILTGSDHDRCDENLADVFNTLGNQDIKIKNDKDKRLNKFHFIFTGGTFQRFVENTDVEDDVKKYVFKECGVTRLPGYEEGGVTLLSYFITQRLCNILWPFFSARQHWLRPVTLALWRLCDHWHVKRLMNRGSVEKWYEKEAETDAFINRQSCPPKLVLRFGHDDVGLAYYKFEEKTYSKNKIANYYEICKIWENKCPKQVVNITNIDKNFNYNITTYSDVDKADVELEIKHPKKKEIKDSLKKQVKKNNLAIKGNNKVPKITNITWYVKHIQESFPAKFEDMTIALIAHDIMKKNMVSFCVDHEWELRKFGQILATGTTGQEVASNTSKVIERKIFRYHSGPKGGDIEIATEILLGRCHMVIFFIDPLNPHPHIDDIRCVFEACMVRDKVIIITNEKHAREFMNRVVRGRLKF